MSAPALCLLLLGWSSFSGTADQFRGKAAETLLTARAVRQLPVEKARRGLPVKLTGVVTHVNPYTSDFWIQDATSGIRIHPGEHQAGLRPGNQVEVMGVTHEGVFAPCVTASGVRKIAAGSLPNPLPFNLSAEESRSLDGQWVLARVIVRGVNTGPGVTRLEVRTARGTGTIVIPGEQWAQPALALRDRVLVVRGVCVATSRNRKIAGPPSIYLSSFPLVPLLPATNSTAAAATSPVSLVEQLLQPSPTSEADWMTISGVATAAPFPGVLTIQDRSGGVTVWMASPRTDIPAGVLVEARGLVRVEGLRIGLARATVRVLGPGVAPTAIDVRPDELPRGSRDALVVKFAAKVDAVAARGDWTAITLVDGPTRIEAFVPGKPATNGLGGLEVGSRVEVTGVPVEATPDGKPSTGACLFLANADSLVLLTAPVRPAPAGAGSWWSKTRVAYLSGGFLVVAVAGAVWVRVLRVRVGRATREVQRQYEAKAKLETQLRESANLEALGRLAGGIAHDFNNLLTVINGCAELLGEETAHDRRLAALADDIRHAGERAAALTSQLLTLSRKRESVVSSVNLNEVVAETARLLGRVIGEDIRIETSLAIGLPAVLGEPGLLHQIIMNLAVNARDAMPHGGTLHLSTSLATDSSDSIPGGQGTPRHCVRLTVTDSGVGMSEEVKARVFEPFFTTKEPGKGTGLGLATVYGVVQSLKGKIRIDSSPGHGTTFRIDLRMCGEPTSRCGGSENDDTPLPGRESLPVPRLVGTTLLVVEDDDMVRELLVTGLLAEGATVFAAGHPDQALWALTERPGGIDVLVTDVVMPGMSGRVLADRVRALCPDVRVVYMSGYTADEVLRQGVFEEEVEFLQKPFTPDSLTTRLLRLLARTK